MSQQKPGEWQEMPERTIPGLANSKAEMLIKLKAAMEALVEKDQKEIAKLRERLSILKHGGGV